MSVDAVCVFCGSRAGNHGRYQQLAEATGRRLAESGATLVYGGGSLGLMGVVSNAALDAGGKVTGIIPTFLRHAEVQQMRLTRTIVTETMLDRKQAMFDLSDAFLILPGGLGTLDELLEVMTWRQLGQIDKPIVLLGEDGFWQPFLALLEHTISEDFASPALRDLVIVTDTLDAAFEALGLAESQASQG
jgi:uncharacterized protein (TIGR00730 family)